MIAATSEPAPGSDAQNEPSCGSAMLPNIWGNHSPICSGVPVAANDAAANPVPRMDSAMPASPQNNSSNTVSIPMPLGSAAWAAKSSIEYKPTFAASWMIGHGVSSRSSHSAAAGRTTCSAKSCTQSRTSITSSDNSSENVMVAAPFDGPHLAHTVAAGRVGGPRDHSVNECTQTTWDRPTSALPACWKGAGPRNQILA